MSQTQKEMKREFLDCAIEDDPLFETIISKKRIEDKVQDIQANRQNDYGDAGVSHDNIASMWTAYIQRKFGFDIFKPEEKLDRVDVAVMMMLMKASRLAYQRKEDTVIDMAAYADFAMSFVSDDE